MWIYIGCALLELVVEVRKAKRLGKVSPHAGDSLENRTADGALVLVDDALASSEGNWIFATVSASM